MDAVLQRLKGVAANFSPTQLATIGGAFVLVVSVVAGSAWWLNSVDYVLLVSEMDAESAGQVIARLKSMKVPYRIDPGGGAIRVPANRVDELRIELSSQGMPASGRIGFEIFDRTAFGATEFLEKVNYRRALEGEIARTIATLSEVAGARVHIAMGKDTLFGEPRPAKASVVLKLRGQRQLSASSIAGISNMVAASVEGLRPESVVILDSVGRPLARPSPEAGDEPAAAQLERQLRLERDLGTRVVALLEPVVGEGRVRVNVALKLDPQTSEQTEERFDPNTVIRSVQRTSDVANMPGAAGAAAGVRSNLPALPGDTTVPTAAAPGAGTARSAETTNYEVSRTTRRVLQPPGDVTRLSVAVILDDGHVEQKQADGTTTVQRVARKPEEIQKIHALVAAAVGLDAARGDQLTVENVAFDEPVFEETAPPSILVRYGPQITEVSRLVTVLVVALLGFLLLGRPLMKGRSEARPTVAGANVVELSRPRTVADLESEIEAQIDAQAAEKAGENRRLPVLTRRVSTLAKDEPEQVAKLLRGWIHEADH